MGWWPSRAVTFLENHDTGSTQVKSSEICHFLGMLLVGLIWDVNVPLKQGHWPFPREKLMQGYAYILTHPGTVSFPPHSC